MKTHWKKSLLSTAIIGLVALAFIPFTLVSQEINREVNDALESGDTTLAIELLEDQIQLDPSYEYNYLILGQIYHKQGKFELAEEQFQTSVDKNKKFLEGLYALSLVQLELGKVDEAEKNIEKGLKKPKDMEAYFHNGMGLVHMARGEYGKADGEMRRALVLDSMVAEFHVNLGNANFQRGVYPLAIDEYERALQLDTASLDVYFHWAEACLELKDYTCALDKLTIVLQKDSTHADAWMKAGGIYYKAARSSRVFNEAKELYKNTIGSYKKYIEISKVQPDSTNGRAFYESGMSYLILTGYQEALENFATVLSIPVEPKDIYFYYARAFQGNQQYDSAIANYERHIEWVRQQGEDFESGIGEVELYRRIGECYEAQKDHYKTISYYKRSLEYDSTQVRLLYGVAVAYNYIQDYRNALIYYMKRIAQGADEKFWSIYYNAAMSALYMADKGGQAMMEEDDLGLEEEGEPVEVEEVDPLEGIDLARLAVEYLEKVTGEFWEKVMSNENNMRTAIKSLNMLGSTYLYQLGECTKGVAALERVFEIDPENCDARKSLGYAYFGGICPNNYNKALRYLTEARTCRVKEVGDQCKDVDLLLWIAQTYHFRAVDKREAKDKEGAKKDFKAAYDTYLEVLKCDPGNKSAIDGRDQVKFEF